VKSVRALRIVLFVIVCLTLTTLLSLFIGPISSGALLLLRPARGPAVAEEIPPDYEPLHKGYVDLATGLYIRENEDLVVPGKPALVLRRTYLSRYHVPRQFGVGATHNGEEFLVGDSERFQWVAVVLATGASIRFKRISSGTSYKDALYVHDDTPTDWRGSRLGWAGLEWVLRKRNGLVATYRSCGRNGDNNCSILESRYPDGYEIHYRRDRAGRLLKMDDGGARWIQFEYDPRNRISRAYDSTGRGVRYEYDGGGRMAQATASDGAVRRYSYTDLDELATIEEPGTSIENTYEDGRCIRQVNRYPDAEPYTFTFTYVVENGAIARTHTKRSDGTWTEYTWGPDRYATSEVRGSEGYEPAVFMYERDPATKAVTALTLTCPDRRGKPLRHSSFVAPGKEEWLKWDLMRTHCSWNAGARKETSDPK
jgi:YD repeat-containing protein